MKKISLIIIISIIFVSINMRSQENPLNPTGKGILLKGMVLDGDTIPVVNLNTVTVEAEMIFKSQKQREQWSSIRFNVKKVYPYAILASAKLKEYERVLSTISNESDKKNYMKVAEKDLKNQFEDQLKSLSMKQGRILIKLIDRETGRTSYDLVKQLRGSLSAWMWQGVARIFGSDLKSEYDKDGEDKLIELAIAQVESGIY